MKILKNHENHEKSSEDKEENKSNFEFSVLSNSLGKLILLTMGTEQ